MSHCVTIVYNRYIIEKKFKTNKKKKSKYQIKHCMFKI